MHLIILINYLSQTGLTIIDSPGVGETDEMDEMVIQYLPKAFAFIYVINSSNAGGVKKDSVSILITFSRNGTCIRYRSCRGDRGRGRGTRVSCLFKFPFKVLLGIRRIFSVRQRTVVYLSCITHHSYHGLWVGCSELINGLIAAASNALVC